MTQVVRRAVQKDLKKIAAIEERCFDGDTAYPREQLEYLAFKANSTCLVEEDEGIILGFVIVLYRRRSRVAGIETLDVDPAFRGMGVGRRLLEAAEQDMVQHGMKRARLEVSQGNVPSVGLHKSMGYTVIEHLENYYTYEHNGTRHALRMVKDLVP